MAGGPRAPGVRGLRGAEPVRTAGPVQGKVLQTRSSAAFVPDSGYLRTFYRETVRPYLERGEGARSPLRVGPRSAVLFQDAPELVPDVLGAGLGGVAPGPDGGRGPQAGDRLFAGRAGPAVRGSLARPRDAGSLKVKGTAVTNERGEILLQFGPGWEWQDIGVSPNCEGIADMTVYSEAPGVLVTMSRCSNNLLAVLGTEDWIEIAPPSGATRAA